ncbi:hypothetical protein DFP72DRAFT_880866 [Ephemerocybe angulata]|uniref:Uncharacterized protein n=1 Tax=Ephemerocybe angulata TaxID=980116 RepID=A0A8H6M9X7_9AGAR|nr:hypothetical protein DFP72DRAFT_880866 [Tulosesus angulatus]
MYDAFYKDGIREGIAFGAAQVMELEDELDRVRLDKANAVSLLGGQERLVGELRGKVRALEEEMAELRRGKTPESWKDESPAKVSVSPRTGRPSVPWARVVAAGLSASTSAISHSLGDARPRAESTGSRPNPDSNSSGFSNGIPPLQVARANRLPPGPPSPSSIRAHRGHSTSISSSLSSTGTHRVPPTNLSHTGPTGGFKVLRPDSPKTNPRLHDPVETWFDYYCTHKKSWPRGVRCDSQRRPILADLRADRAIARFRPAASVRMPQDTTSNAAGTIMSTGESDNSEVGGVEIGFPAPSPRNQFKNMAVSLFCQQGLYAKRVRELGLSIAPSETYDEYTGPFPISVDDVVRHLARAGVTTEGLAVDLETWARNYEAGVNCSIPFTPSSVVQRMRRC